MKNNKKASIFIFILILISIILTLGYVVFNNVIVMNNNIDIGKNGEQVFKNVQQKGDINIKTDLQYNGNGNGFEDFISCPTNITMSGSTQKTTGIISEMRYELGSYFCIGIYNSKEFRIYFDNVTHDFNRVFFEGDIVNLVSIKSGTTGTNTRQGEREFNDSDNTLISFDETGVGGGDNIDDNFNSDDYKVTSTGSIYYPDGFQDDDVIPRLTIFGEVKTSNNYENIFWTNYKTNDFIDKNINNNDLLNAKIGDISDGNIYLDFFSTSPDIKYDLKIYIFDRNAYKNDNTLLLLKSYKVDDYNKNSGFVTLSGSTLGLSTVRNGDIMSFDFKNKDYAIFVINKLDSNLSYRITGESSTGTGLYINPIDDSYLDKIESLSNHMIIGDEKNFIGEQFIIVGEK